MGAEWKMKREEGEALCFSKWFYRLMGACFLSGESERFRVYCTRLLRVGKRDLVGTWTEIDTRREGETRRRRGKKELSSLPLPQLRVATTGEASSIGAVRASSPSRRHCVVVAGEQRKREEERREEEDLGLPPLSSSSLPPLLLEAAVPEEATVPSCGSRATTAAMVN
ncbi:hypothetical protein PIB30_022713 [Stylosanthes scabra]|uniref:Uncharacterized protein n=1 Tax=Stylosanthes scabra TaxID=79078 RepID=A0ABU6Y9F4_9FABA|nr:hypothetical protein [Stylosanthes scabra]